jgi:hypothetical protein
MMASKGWLQGVALVMIFGFFVMGMLALRTYTDGMALPERVVDETGEVVYTQDDVTSGQQIFLRGVCSSTARSSGTADTSAPTTPLTTCDAPRPLRLRRSRRVALRIRAGSSSS